jgi:hypothetical protein
VAKKATSGAPTKARAANAKSASAPAKAATAALGQILGQLESLGNEAVRKQNAKWAAGGIQPGATQFGVKHGDIRALAKKIGPDRALALSLWQTRNVDAQLLAVLLLKPKDLSAKDVDGMVRSITFGWVADWLINYVVKQHADRGHCARSGWSTTTAGQPAPAGPSPPSGSRRALTGSTSPLYWTESSPR